jgi:hypothetical protein
LRSVKQDEGRECGCGCGLGVFGSLSPRVRTQTALTRDNALSVSRAWIKWKLCCQKLTLKSHMGGRWGTLNQCLIARSILKFTL